MKRVILLLCAVGLAGCSGWNPLNSANPGNPSNTPYAGEPGGIFDVNAGPPRPVRPEPDFSMPPAAVNSQMPVTTAPLPPR